MSQIGRSAPTFWNQMMKPFWNQMMRPEQNILSKSPVQQVAARVFGGLAHLVGNILSLGYMWRATHREGGAETTGEKKAEKVATACNVVTQGSKSELRLNAERLIGECKEMKRDFSVDLEGDAYRQLAITRNEALKKLPKNECLELLKREAGDEGSVSEVSAAKILYETGYEDDAGIKQFVSENYAPDVYQKFLSFYDEDKKQWQPPAQAAIPTRVVIEAPEEMTLECKVNVAAMPSKTKEDVKKIVKAVGEERNRLTRKMAEKRGVEGAVYTMPAVYREQGKLRNEAVKKLDKDDCIAVLELARKKGWMTPVSIGKVLFESGYITSKDEIIAFADKGISRNTTVPLGPSFDKMLMDWAAPRVTDWNFSEEQQKAFELIHKCNAYQQAGKGDPALEQARFQAVLNLDRGAFRDVVILAAEKRIATPESLARVMYEKGVKIEDITGALAVVFKDPNISVEDMLYKHIRPNDPEGWVQPEETFGWRDKL